MNGVFWNPVEVNFGPGCIARLPEILNGRRAAVVTFAEAAQIGLVQRVRELCGDSVVAVIDDVQPNPDVTHLAGLYRDFWKKHEDCPVIVAIGGGSVLDTAKALMVGTQSNEFDELLTLLDTGKPFTPPRVKSLITVPTTAGTGSEVTPWATIWDRTIKQRKYSLQAPADVAGSRDRRSGSHAVAAALGDGAERSRRAIACARSHLERQREPDLR